MTDAELYPIMNEIRNNMKKLGIQCSERITEIKFTNQRKSWGRCYKIIDGWTTPRYRITLSDMLKRTGVDIWSLKSVLAHEILHTCPNCWCHTGEFARLAKILKEEYGYGIEESSYKDLKIPEEIYRDEKYVIKCSECGQLYSYNKRKKWFSRLNECGCGTCKKKGTLKFIKGGY